jgi:hypothetical protein
MLTDTEITIMRADGEFSVTNPDIAFRFVVPVRASVQSFGQCTIRIEAAHFRAAAPLDVRPSSQ